jgi:hypothetical protein
MEVAVEASAYEHKSKRNSVYQYFPMKVHDKLLLPFLILQNGRVGSAA